MKNILILAVVALASCTQTITPAEPVTDSVSVDSVVVDTIAADTAAVVDSVK